MSSRLSLSNVRLNNVGLACVTLLLLIGVSSFTTANGNEFDDSESHSGRSRLHHSRPSSSSSSSSAILDAHQEVIPISLVESLAEESHAVEVDVGSDFITVYGDEENEELITDINEEDQAMAAVRAGYEQRQQQQGQLNSAVKKFSRTAMTKRQQELASQKAAQTAEAQLKGQAAKNKKSSVPSRRRTSGGINKKYLTARNGPTRAVRKKLGVFLELETELESELESESELKSMVAVGAYPAYSLGAAPGGILQTVGILRNAIQADPAPPAHPPLELNGFTYVLDGGAAGAQVGRIQSVRGDVRPPVTTRPVKQLPVEWCDVQFNPNAPFVGPLVLAGRTRAAGGGRRIQQSGHIIGYAIGGSSDHAINFYPQHRSSNNQGGRWGKTEAIALHVAAACPFAIVTVDIVFTAWHANGYPTAGNYRVEADAGCVAALGVNCVQTGAAGPAVPVGVGNAYVRTFCRWAAAPGGGVLRYSSPFSNGVGDVINNLGPLAAQYFP